MFEEFEKRRKQFATEAEQAKKKADSLGNIRLAVFLAGAAISAFLFAKAGLVFGLPALVLFLAVFILLVIKYGRYSSEAEWLRRMADINQRYLDRMGTKWVDFVDSGAEYMDDSHPYTSDLDLFGPKSLFQWLNVAHTHYGRLTLSGLLKAPDKEPDSLSKRQQAVLELAGKLEFCQELQCEAMGAKGAANDPAELLAYAEDRSKRFRSDKIINLFYLLPGSVILTFVLFFLGAPVPLFLPLLLLAGQMLLCAVGYKKNAQIINTVYGLRRNFEAFGSLLRRLERETFRDETLSSLREEFFREEEPASASLKKLESIANAIDIKFSTVLYFILNFGFLWDYHCVFALEEWKRKYGSRIRVWLETVGRIEALSSLAVPGLIYPDWAVPEFADGEKPVIAASALGHPLIAKESCVRNDFEISAGACVITGSNMSGKTTLLRTVGINLVLAYAGAQVFADRLNCSRMELFTSMRIRDDLNGGISTFYAELLRIKTIIEFSQKRQPMLYLIDEIFMGTNSPDRIAGARSVLKNLSRGWIIGLISTHDFELCDLEKEAGAIVKNDHFTEHYENNEIRFDYKLRPGRSQTTNARYLMKMVGIDLSE